MTPPVLHPIAHNAMEEMFIADLSVRDMRKVALAICYLVSSFTDGLDDNTRPSSLANEAMDSDKDADNDRDQI